MYILAFALTLCKYLLFFLTHNASGSVQLILKNKIINRKTKNKLIMRDLINWYAINS